VRSTPRTKRSISSFWDGKLHMTKGFAALSSHIYAFGGLSISDIYKLDLTGRGPYSLKPVPSMISPNFYPCSFALDKKIYVFSSHLGGTCPTVHWGEVFDPENGKWEALPDPPYDMSFIIHSAALKNPSRILVAFHVPDTRYSAMFYTYNVQHRSWEMLAPPQRKIHSMFPRSCFQMTITAHNTSYWASYWVKKDKVKEEDEEEAFLEEEEAFLIAYNLDLDTWLQGSLLHLGISSDPVPCLLHLENKRFCLLQTVCDYLSFKDKENIDVCCVVVDISHMPEENRLVISLVWEQKYNVDSPFGSSDCLLL
jgi:hypothetical protein